MIPGTPWARMAGKAGSSPRAASAFTSSSAPAAIMPSGFSVLSIEEPKSELRRKDGAVIVVDNEGIIVPGSGGIGYARTNPRFHAPQGKYDWLNKTLFVGTITPATQGGAVIIRVFKVL